MGRVNPDKRISGLPGLLGLLFGPYVSLLTLLVLGACGTMPSGHAPVSERGATTEAPKPAAKPAPKSASQPIGDTDNVKRGGGYYKDDGPGDNPPENMDAIPDAVPKAEPPHRFANRPYYVLGRSYTPMLEAGHYKARGLASWYGKKFHGQKTSNGEIYDMYSMTAAHTTLPLPSYARVTSLTNGKSVIVRVNDRGPFHPGRIIDLSYTAASKLGYVGKGSGMVEVESLAPGALLIDMPPVQMADKSVETASAPAPALAVASEDRRLPEAEAATEAASVPANGTWLQLGAFGSRANAEALKTRLMRELVDMSDKLVVRVTGNLFRVQLGPWADVQEARDMAEKLGGRLEMKPVLVSK